MNVSIFKDPSGKQWLQIQVPTGKLFLDAEAAVELVGRVLLAAKELPGEIGRTASAMVLALDHDVVNIEQKVKEAVEAHLAKLHEKIDQVLTELHIRKLMADEPVLRENAETPPKEPQGATG